MFIVRLGNRNVGFVFKTSRECYRSREQCQSEPRILTAAEKMPHAFLLFESPNPKAFPEQPVRTLEGSPQAIITHPH